MASPPLVWVSSAPEAGADCCGGLFTCAPSGIASSSKAIKIGSESLMFRGTCLVSGYDDGVLGLNLYVLLRILTLNHLFVVKRQPGLGAVGVLAQHVDRFLFGEIA